MTDGWTERHQATLYYSYIILRKVTLDCKLHRFKVSKTQYLICRLKTMDLKKYLDEVVQNFPPNNFYPLNQSFVDHNWDKD